MRARSAARALGAVTTMPVAPDCATVKPAPSDPSRRRMSAISRDIASRGDPGGLRGGLGLSVIVRPAARRRAGRGGAAGPAAPRPRRPRPPPPRSPAPGSRGAEGRGRRGPRLGASPRTRRRIRSASARSCAVGDADAGTGLASASWAMTCSSVVTMTLRRSTMGGEGGVGERGGHVPAGAVEARAKRRGAAPGRPRRPRRLQALPCDEQQRLALLGREPHHRRGELLAHRRGRIPVRGPGRVRRPWSRAVERAPAPFGPLLVGHHAPRDAEQPRQRVLAEGVQAPPGDEERLGEHILSGRRRGTSEHVRAHRPVVGGEQLLEGPAPIDRLVPSCYPNCPARRDP